MKYITILLFAVLLVGQKVEARNIWGQIGQAFVSCEFSFSFPAFVNVSCEYF